MVSGDLASDAARICAWQASKAAAVNGAPAARRPFAPRASGHAVSRSLLRGDLVAVDDARLVRLDDRRLLQCRRFPLPQPRMREERLQVRSGVTSGNHSVRAKAEC